MPRNSYESLLSQNVSVSGDSDEDHLKLLDRAASEGVDMSMMEEVPSCFGVYWDVPASAKDSDVPCGTCPGKHACLEVFSKFTVPDVRETGMDLQVLAQQLCVTRSAVLVAIAKAEQPNEPESPKVDESAGPQLDLFSEEDQRQEESQSEEGGQMPTKKAAKKPPKKKVAKKAAKKTAKKKVTKKKVTEEKKTTKKKVTKKRPPVAQSASPAAVLGKGKKTSVKRATASAGQSQTNASSTRKKNPPKKPPKNPPKKPPKNPPKKKAMTKKKSKKGQELWGEHTWETRRARERKTSLLSKVQKSVGLVLETEYKGRKFTCTVESTGYRFNNKVYPTLGEVTSIARGEKGSYSAPRFWRLDKVKLRK